MSPLVSASSKFSLLIQILNAAAVKGNIALVDRGGCEFMLKARHLQEVGAKGMVVDNAAGPVTGLGGSDPSIRIPAVRISLEAGAALKAALALGPRTQSGVAANLLTDPERLAGTDNARRVRMFAPADFDPGSSVSHFSTDAKPNQLMEPSINGDLTHEVSAQKDLTHALLVDIGW
ncbi:PA domain-containing protein [Massilia cavernae]|uniref:PA domain-containing protein n=1 Tax=Massilia cavernae TaxID=2320864 RepID=UPI001E5C20EC|nr:PA domain-containing protein [Massilia cavernae]